MEHTGIIAGVIFGLLVFAFKAGIGIAYRLSTLSSMRQLSGKKYVILGSSVAYLMLFVGMSYLAKAMDITLYIGRLLPMLRTGTTIHILLCVSMAAWAVYLLSKRSLSCSLAHCNPQVAFNSPKTPLPAPASTTWAWLTLALPCPVCMSVVLFSLSFLQAIFPERLLYITLGLYLIFMLTVFLSAYAFHRIKATNSPERVLAHLMLGISGYFLLLLVISPQVQGLTEIYDLVAKQYASNPMTDTAAHTSLSAINLLGILTLLISAVTGFLMQKHRTKRAVMK
jgi:hypothetical protein